MNRPSPYTIKKRKNIKQKTMELKINKADLRKCCRLCGKIVFPAPYCLFKENTMSLDDSGYYCDRFEFDNKLFQNNNEGK